MRKLSLATTLLALALFAACARSVEPSNPDPTATPAAQTQSVAPAALIDSELLGAPGVAMVCDQSDGAQLSCTDLVRLVLLDVTVDASGYARWSLRWQDTASPLTGDEVLTLRLTLSGPLTPNLYLVQQDGARIYTPLSRFGLHDGANLLHVPLREVKDEQGNNPDFAQVNEIQIVFEWLDMAGQLAIESVQFASVWEETVTLSEAARELAAGLTAPDGFAVEAVVDDLREMTQVDFTPDGSMLVSMQNGRVWWYEDGDGDGSYESRRLYTAGFVELVGLLYDPVDGAVWVGGRGQLYRLLDSDGNSAADVRELRIDGLPWGRHQNNGLAWNLGPDPFSGEAEYHWIYFGLGSTEDLIVGGDLSATVLRFPRDGQSADDLAIVSAGNRNAYMVVWAPVPVDLASPDGATAWQLFASENGPDFNDAPDEVNHIRWGRHYGFPAQFGMVEPPAQDGMPYTSPVYPAKAHTSASGIAYVTNPAWPAEYRTLYVTLFGQVFSPGIVGHTVERVSLQQVDTATGPTYRGEPSDFIVGLDRPLALMTSPQGDLVVGDYATGVIYRVRYAGGTP